MSFSEIDAVIVAHELQERMGGLVISDVIGSKDQIILSFKSKGIFLKARPPGQRLCGFFENITGPRHKWRAHLRGWRFISARARLGDRIILLDFTKQDRLGHQQRLGLVVELTGKYGNAVLVSDHNKVIDALRLIRPGESRHRTLLPGQDYTFPPAKEKSAFNLYQDELLDYLKRHAPAAALNWHEDWSVDDYVQRAIEFGKGLIYLEREQPVLLSPLPVKNPPGDDVLEFPGYSQALDAFFKWNYQQPRSEPGPGKIEKTRKLMRERLERERLNAQRFYRWGQLIMQNLYLIKPGDTSITLDSETIPLDPKLSPGQNADRYFQRYKKAKRGIGKLEQALKELDREADPTAETQDQQGQASQGPETPFRRFTSPSGFTVLAGKSARSNNQLTFRKAGPKDLFFHVRGWPGAHVILLTQGKEVPEQDIEFAARIAFALSKARHQTKAWVSFAQRKYVVRPKRARPGLVVLLREQVIQIRNQPELLPEELREG